MIDFTLSVEGLPWRKWVDHAAHAAAIDGSDNHGGRVTDYDARLAGLASRGADVRIVGPCESACTVLLGHFQRSRICGSRAASFHFHVVDVTSQVRNHR